MAVLSQKQGPKIQDKFGPEYGLLGSKIGKASLMQSVSETKLHEIRQMAMKDKRWPINKEKVSVKEIVLQVLASVPLWPLNGSGPFQMAVWGCRTIPRDALPLVMISVG